MSAGAGRADAGCAGIRPGPACGSGAPRDVADRPGVPQDAARGAAPLLSLREVTVRFGRTVGLDRVTITVHPGETVAVIGPDGAGKSTLLRVMAGLVRPGSGLVESALSRGGLGYAGATFDLYSDLTVVENLTFFGQVRGMERERLLERVEAMLLLTGLEDARDRLAARLSGGMKKGLALGCALVHEPALLLLDEPTVGVDPVSRQRLWDIIGEAIGAGTALVFTSCYLEEADRAGRLAVMAGGRLVRTTVHEVMAGSAGWSAWVLPVPEHRAEVRARLAGGGSDIRVYLRPEGLAVLATDKEAARRLIAEKLGDGPARGDLSRRPLTLEDAFVLMENRERGGVGPEPRAAQEDQT